MQTLALKEVIEKKSKRTEFFFKELERYQEVFDPNIYSKKQSEIIKVVRYWEELPLNLIDESLKNEYSSKGLALKEFQEFQDSFYKTENYPIAQLSRDLSAGKSDNINPTQLKRYRVGEVFLDNSPERVWKIISAMMRCKDKSKVWFKLRFVDEFKNLAAFFNKYWHFEIFLPHDNTSYQNIDELERMFCLDPIKYCIHLLSSFKVGSSVEEVRERWGKKAKIDEMLENGDLLQKAGKLYSTKRDYSINSLDAKKKLHSVALEEFLSTKSNGGGSMFLTADLDDEGQSEVAVALKEFYQRVMEIKDTHPGRKRTIIHGWRRNLDDDE